MGDIPYRRLTRARLRSAFAVAITSRASLWLGPDHLLVIDTNGYTERYKRFYFRDIQAITIVLNRRRSVWNWILGLLVGFSAAIWWSYFFSNGGFSIGLAIFGGCILLLGVPLVLNNLFGPTCTCHLQTAVQTEHLCSLARLRKARKVMGLLRPLILQAQGGPLAAPETAPQPEAISSAEPAAFSPEVPVPAEIPSPDSTTGEPPRIAP